MNRLIASAPLIPLRQFPTHPSKPIPSAAFRVRKGVRSQKVGQGRVRTILENRSDHFLFLFLFSLGKRVLNLGFGQRSQAYFSWRPRLFHGIFLSELVSSIDLSWSPMVSMSSTDWAALAISISVLSLILSFSTSARLPRISLSLSSIICFSRARLV